MAIVQASHDPGLEKFQTLLGNFVASDKEVESSITVGANGQTIVDICKNGHADTEQSLKVQEKYIDVNVWSPVQTILSLTTLMLVERGVLDANEMVSKYWPEYPAEREKDVEIRQFLSTKPHVSGSDKEVTIEDLSELVRRTDGRSLEQFISEDIASPLGLDLHPWMEGARQQESKSRSRSRIQSLTSKSEDPDFCTEPVKNGHALNGVSADEENERANLKKLYPQTIPPHRSHPSALDFSVIDQGPIGKALVTHRCWQQGDFMARFDGLTVPEVMLHTLQKTKGIHLWDPHFIGNLAHSCDPNVMLDMVEHEMWAVHDIEAGTVLTMDYASTEDHLFRTFQCQCTAPGCRGEVTGRKQRRSTYTPI